MTENTRHATPDVAELRRLYEEAMRVDSNEMAWDEWTTAISEAAEDLFDAAAIAAKPPAPAPSPATSASPGPPALPPAAAAALARARGRVSGKPPA